MVKACIERIINLPVDRAWEILSDYSNVHHIHPLVKTVDQITPDKDRGVGAVRQCNMYDGHKAVEKIIEWDEENRSYKVELIDTDMPMKSVIASLAVEDAGAGKTKLVAKMQVKAKYGVLGKAMEYLVMKPQLGGAVGNLFAGVEEYSKTGRDIQKGYKAKTPAFITAC